LLDKTVYLAIKIKESRQNGESVNSKSPNKIHFIFKLGLIYGLYMAQKIFSISKVAIAP